MNDSTTSTSDTGTTIALVVTTALVSLGFGAVIGAMLGAHSERKRLTAWVPQSIGWVNGQAVNASTPGASEYFHGVATGLQAVLDETPFPLQSYVP